jgi:hypothetical protein
LNGYRMLKKVSVIVNILLPCSTPIRPPSDLLYL